MRLSGDLVAERYFIGKLGLHAYRQAKFSGQVLLKNSETSVHLCRFVLDGFGISTIVSAESCVNFVQ